MPLMTGTKIPRHMRLFELMRQKERAEQTAARVACLPRQISSGQADAFKEMAQQSLMRRL
ncbi:hypothetical protein [Pseudosulfitobacter koreensis]|uniref:Uncharacterized protein n=1 Tax=Pseudosulfitobacter koreensis TaxID=2968472 RepID=A0ABT1Z0E7_9RHOB|nr:hypothetical protein [Pseudosulfitobacter koreense]MCR8826598.1 hypothetical protein [Pseudosulfitobacter koreense]